MDRILVATDLSDRSERALERAFQLAEQHDAALTVLHVSDRDLPTELAVRMRAEAKTLLDDQCARLSPRPREIRVEIDDPMSRIYAEADEVDADLVIFGAARRRPLLSLFGGSTVERLVRASRRPALLAVSAVNGPYAHPVCGIDLSPSCAAAAAAAARLAPEAEVTTFHAVHAPFRGMMAASEENAEAGPFVDAAQRDIDAWLATSPLPDGCARPKILIGGVETALMTTLRAVSGDLIAVGAHGRSAFSPTYLGGFAADLVRTPPCDLLLVRG